MIISRTPLRMSFTGGGSDLPDYYRRFGGAVISTAIDKYVYVTVNRKFDSAIRIAYSKTEEVAHASKIEHQLVRATLNHLGLAGGVEITTVADIPSRGTGLGSSSSFTVALLQGLSAYMGRNMTSEELAAASSHIEIVVCQEPIGKQDQYAAAYGGFNLIEFLQDDAVRVSPVIGPRETAGKLQARLLVLYTGITRSASNILRTQSEGMLQSETKLAALHQMVRLTYTLRDELQRGNYDAMGMILHENWELKKSLAGGISSPDIDRWYDVARKCGALGGKLLGAGGGGFMLFDAPPDRHEAICHALPELRQVDIAFERFGSQVIFYCPT